MGLPCGRENSVAQVGFALGGEAVVPRGARCWLSPLGGGNLGRRPDGAEVFGHERRTRQRGSGILMGVRPGLPVDG